MRNSTPIHRPKGNDHPRIASVLASHCRACRFIRQQRIHLPSNPMRVIGGTYRSRRLIAPRGLATRPTSDRLRETLFNVSGPAYRGRRVRRSLCRLGGGRYRGSQPRRDAWSTLSIMQLLRLPRYAPISLRCEIRSGFRIESCSVSSALRRLSDTNYPSAATSFFWIRRTQPSERLRPHPCQHRPARGFPAHTRRDRDRRTQPQNETRWRKATARCGATACSSRATRV